MDIVGQLLDRASRDDYYQWLSHVRSAAGCTHPIRLAGELVTIETGTGRLLEHTATAELPDGVLYTPCGNRRSSVCPSCAETYRRDAYQLIHAGLTGGKGIPHTVAGHPAVFATFTAPSFGPVHTRRTAGDGSPLPCRPRRQPDLCPHGADLRCHRLHGDTHRVLGTPLCPDCYDHEAQVVWNAYAGELWRRTRIAIDRATRRATGDMVRLRYVKIAEFQTRGVVHFHAVIRADGHHPDLPGAILPTPPGYSLEHLQQLLTTVVPTVAFTTGEHPHQPAGWPITWGTQLDIRPIQPTRPGELTNTAAAGYLAKYATKSTEATGHSSRRLDPDTVDLYADPHGSHTERLIDACWRLGAVSGWHGLRRWAHMLGYGGHFLTKARTGWPTFTALRQARTTWRRQQRHPDHDAATTRIIGWLTYVAAGWKTPADALLANTAAARAREQADAARDALAYT